MFKAIIVPLDGSALAEQALPTAARLARATDAALHLVHAHVAASPDPILIEDLPVVDEELRSLAAEHEQVYLERAAATLGGDGLEVVVARLDGHGSPVRALCSYARDREAGLIVMTSHGHSGFAHLWLGSVAESMVRVTSTPLLMLRPDAGGTIADRPFKHILVPLDGSPLAEEILPQVMALAELEGGALTALRVVNTLAVPAVVPFHQRFKLDEGTVARECAEAEQYLARVAEGLAPRRVATVVRECEQPARAVIEAAAELGADLVAMTTHGRSAGTRSPLSGVTDKVLRGTSLPLLILRPSLPQAE